MMWLIWFYHTCSPKHADRLANSTDPDQTAPVIWVYTVCPDLSFQKLGIITVLVVRGYIREWRGEGQGINQNGDVV